MRHPYLRDSGEASPLAGVLRVCPNPTPSPICGSECTTRVQERLISLARPPSSSLRGTSAIALVICLVLSGCTTARVDPSDVGEDAPGVPRPIAVAVIDTGINPYHEAFLSVGPTFDGIAGAPLDLTLGLEPSEGLEVDRSTWASVVPDQLYHIPGTRLAMISTSGIETMPLGFDVRGHGTGTASVVADMAPDALIVSVQINDRVCTDGTCIFLPSFAAGLAWAAEQPWIDVISMSMAVPGNLPDDERVHAEARAIREATRLASESGKLVVISAGNHGTPTIQSYIAGPPWVVSVGGVSDTRGHSIWSSSYVDVVANYTQLAASELSRTGRDESSGTSYSAPTVAGVLAHLLSFAPMEERGTVELRERARDALNHTALAIDPTQWRPETDAEVGLDKPPQALTKASTPSVLPAHTGWGYVDGSIRERLLEVWDGDPATVDPVVAAHQAQFQRARENAWA